MKKTSKYEHALTEHSLVPIALMATNVCAMHLIYAFTWGAYVYTGQFFALLFAALLLILSLIYKGRLLLIFGIVYYVTFVLWLLIYS